MKCETTICKIWLQVTISLTVTVLSHYSVVTLNFMLLTVLHSKTLEWYSSSKLFLQYKKIVTIKILEQFK